LESWTELSEFKMITNVQYRVQFLRDGNKSGALVTCSATKSIPYIKV